MVTIRRNDGYPALSRVCGDVASHYLAENWITRLFVDIIMTFHETWYCIEPIRCFSIMPDHIHLLIKIRDIEKRVSLAVIVRVLARALEKAYFALAGASAGRTPTDAKIGVSNAGGTPTGAKGAVTGAGGRSGADVRSGGQHLFAFAWHDWIVKADGQLTAFTRYIRENPRRAWLRRENRRFFTQVRRVSFAGREWFAYGNAALLELPVIEPFRCSRKWAEDGEEWREAVGRAARIGPGGAGAGTFMSPCEKLCGNEIFKAGGALIVLSPEGFGPRWHPTRNKEALCAKGHMLFLSLWEPQTARPDNATLYRRCHEMGDAILGGLGRSKTLKGVSSRSFALNNQLTGCHEK